LHGIEVTQFYISPIDNNKKTIRIR